MSGRHHFQAPGGPAPPAPSPSCAPMPPHSNSPHIHCTPPRSNVRKIKNPFERTLVESLNNPMCSPGMFRIKESGSFKWDIEHISILKPADIVPCNSQFYVSPDPVLEKKASEAISKFFARETIVPSPLAVEPKRTVLKAIENLCDISNSSSNKCTAWTQTTLSFPAVLPPEVEEALKPYYSFKNEQNTYDADMSANTSLRRKLRFEEVCSDEEEVSPSVIQETPFSEEDYVSRGIKRSLNSTHSSTSQSLDANMESQSVSPILNLPPLQSRYQSDKILQHTKSPSLSPIKSAISSEAINANMSPKSEMYHRNNISSFSQSTPEKSNASGLDFDSSPDSFELTKTKLYQINKNYSKFSSRSHSESSLNNFKKNISVLPFDTNMDISSDISLHYSHDQSLRELSGLGGSTDSLSIRTRTSNNLEMEFIETDLNIQISKTVTDTIHTSNFVNSGDFKCDAKSAINQDSCDTFPEEVFRLLTPTKSLKKDLTDILQGSSHKKVWQKSFSSPMQMSLDNSFNLDHDRSNAKNFNNDTKLFDTIHSENEESKLIVPLNLNSETFYRMDSGFMDSLCKSNSTALANSTRYNSSKYASVADTTKSFQNSVDSSNWKRFDSGFHDETSSDFVQQTGDNPKAFHKKYSSISEHFELEDDFNKFLEHGSRIRASVAENFEDIVPLSKYNCSTPSKNQCAK